MITLSGGDEVLGAGITQLAECQLPKLKVAGSTPVARSITLLIPMILMLLLSPTVAAQTETDADDDGSGYWSGYSYGSVSASPVDAVETLRNMMRNGQRDMLIPLVTLLVSEGRIREAEAWMEGRGLVLPVTRRDLGIALAWFGRFELYPVLSQGAEVPPDLQDDDYGPTIAAVVRMGWMSTGPGGLFHPEALVGRDELSMLAGLFLPEDLEWQRDWIGLSELDMLLELGPDG